jgi:hypothetical protein
MAWAATAMGGMPCGDADAQSEQLYRALQARRVEAALVRSGGDEAEELEAVIGWLLK